MKYHKKLKQNTTKTKMIKIKACNIKIYSLSYEI